MAQAYSISTLDTVIQHDLFDLPVKVRTKPQNFCLDATEKALKKAIVQDRLVEKLTNMVSNDREIYYVAHVIKAGSYRYSVKAYQRIADDSQKNSSVSMISPRYDWIYNDLLWFTIKDGEIDVLTRYNPEHLECVCVALEAPLLHAYLGM